MWKRRASTLSDAPVNERLTGRSDEKAAADRIDGCRWHFPYFFVAFAVDGWLLDRCDAWRQIGRKTTHKPLSVKLNNRVPPGGLGSDFWQIKRKKNKNKWHNDESSFCLSKITRDSKRSGKFKNDVVGFVRDWLVGSAPSQITGGKNRPRILQSKDFLLFRAWSTI